jgi:lipid-A-disaccharide synthase
VEVNWVGHPLIELERSERAGYAENGSDSSPVLALFPGSRGQELERLLPVFLEVAAGMPHFRPIIAGAPGLGSSQYQLAADSGVEVRFGKTRELMKQAAIGLVTSGTATLEAALLGMPQVICYKTSFLTYQIAKRLAKTEWIGLPNIIAQASIVPERIQEECTAAILLNDLNHIHDGKKLLDSGKKQMTCFERLRQQLEGPQEPSRNVAEAILDYNPRST